MKNYINGQLLEPAAGNYFDNVEPATAKVYAQIPDSDEKDVAHAVEAAKNAFEYWSNCGVQTRYDYLMKIVHGIEARFDEFVAAESMDNGKPLKLAARVDIPRAIENFRFFATAILHFASESHFMEQTAINYTLRRPLGVVACISPWNLPLYLFSWKVAPALAAGNCIVAKPSEITPYTAYLLAEVCKEAALPAGVFNIIHGLGHKAGQAMVEHPDVKAISFTGGTATGKKIAATAAPQFKKLSLELGGKNPNIIFADCDLDEAVETSVMSSFANQGQICLCGSRIFIQQEIYDAFKEAFVQKVKSLTIGDPQTEVNLGAVVSKDHFNKVLSYINLAKQEGGNILAGGKAMNPGGRCAEGYFIEPTVIENLTYNCRTNMEEIFGPVVTLTPFTDEADVLNMANAVDYGLSATVWTENLKRAHRLAEKLQCGIVWVNTWLLRDLRTPFGGAKSSGVGREGGWEALRFFTEPKNICIKQ